MLNTLLLTGSELTQIATSLAEISTSLHLLVIFTTGVAVFYVGDKVNNWRN